jgi:hypothetical protein
MSDDAEDAVIWEISAREPTPKNPATISLESFFMAKLGVNAGKNLYKELLRVIDKSDNVAVNLGEPCGPFVKYRSL